MARKQYIVMWTSRPNSLASTREDYNRMVLNPRRNVQRVIVSRPGYEDVVAGNILPTNYGRITFNGITEWFIRNHWNNRKVFIPFSVEYDRDTETLKFTYLG